MSVFRKNSPVWDIQLLSEQFREALKKKAFELEFEGSGMNMWPKQKRYCWKMEFPKKSESLPEQAVLINHALFIGMNHVFKQGEKDFIWKVKLASPELL